MSTLHTMIPSENWDDDFEFQQQITTPTTSTSIHNALNDQHVEHRLSMASSDWDHDTNVNGNDTTPNKNIKNIPRVVGASLAAKWSQPGPSTPRKLALDYRHSPRSTTENWDDDFEVSPARTTATGNSMFPSPPRSQRPSKRQPRKDAVESWDAEFEDPNSPARPTVLSPSTPSSQLRSHVRCSRSSSSDECNSEHPASPGDDLDFEDSDKDEDRTVTTRSRRAALARLTNTRGSAPTPPLPVSAPQSLFMHPASNASSPHPFPCSPAPSVFSVPRPPSSSGYTVTSTTHLHPTVSSSSSGILNSTPSPPVHRERRRLRKKSRPPGVGAEPPRNRLHPQDHEFDSTDDNVPEPENVEVAPRTPPPPVASAVFSSNGHPGTPSGFNASTSAASTLFSRIGSVKKWGVRRKRGSTSDTPAPDVTTQVASESNSRPKSRSSLMSIPSSSSSRVNLATKSKRLSGSPTNQTHFILGTPGTGPSTWFFRSGSGGSTGTTTSSAPSAYPSSVSTSATSPSPMPHTGPGPRPGSGPRVSTSEQNLRDRGMSTISGGTPPPVAPAPVNKLVKRKSFGFVQLCRGIGLPGDDRHLGGGWGKDAKTREGTRRSASAQHQYRQPSPLLAHFEPKYAGLGIGRANGCSPPGSGCVTPQEDEEAQSRMFGGDANDCEKRKLETESKDGSDKARQFADVLDPEPRSFIRRLSLTPRHKRTQSAASAAESILAGTGLDVRRDATPPRPKTGVMQSSTKLTSFQIQRPQTANRALLSVPPAPTIEPPVPPLLPSAELQAQTNSSVAETARNTSRDVTSSGSPSRGGGGSLSRSPGTAPLESSSPRQSHSHRIMRSPGSPQSASLGRSSIVPTGVVGSGVGSGLASGEKKEKERDIAKEREKTRRSSLGDLKIPERISQAQVGLRRDLGMVREFAANIEQLKVLQAKYIELVTQVQDILDEQMHLHAQQQQRQRELENYPERATSPSFFANLNLAGRSLIRSNTSTSNRSRSKSKSGDSGPSSPTSFITTTKPLLAPQATYKQLAAAFYTINSRYRLSWECAELLVELAGGKNNETDSSARSRNPPTSASAPAMHSVLNNVSNTTGGSGGETRKVGRERAITLESQRPGSPPGNPGPGQAWRASTGRHDLSHRQIVLLKEMLTGSESASVAFADPAEDDEGHRHGIPHTNVNREWRWGNAMSSTVTLPSEESSVNGREREYGKLKKKRVWAGGRGGMLGLRDMLRLLKRSAQVEMAGEGVISAPASVASASASTTEGSSQEGGHLYMHQQLPVQPSYSNRTPPPTRGRRRAKTSFGPDTMRRERPTSPIGSLSLSFSGLGKPSPRRPSLASIFRLGHKHREKEKERSSTDNVFPADNMSRVDFTDMCVSRPQSACAWSIGKGGSGDGMGMCGVTGEEADEDDWDQIDLALDGDECRPQGGNRTLRGKKNEKTRKGESPYQQTQQVYQVTPTRRSMSGSHSSIWRESSSGASSGEREQAASSAQPALTQSTGRPTRLSNVEEDVGDRTPQLPPPPVPVIPASVTSGRLPSRTEGPNSSSRPPSTGTVVVLPKTGSVRSMPQTQQPHPQLALTATAPGPDPKLAMTPENIKPLLDNAKEVLSRLNQCVAEIQALLATYVPS